MHCTAVLRQNFASVISPSCLPTLRQKLVWKAVLFIFRQHIRVLPELTCLRRATCLSYSPFHRCRIWVCLLNWIQKETKLHVQHLWRVLRTSQSRVSGRLARRNMCRNANQHIQLTHENWTKMKMINLLFVQREAQILKTRMINLSCSLHQEKHQMKENRESAPARRNPTQVRIRKGPQAWQDPSAKLEQEVSGDSRERSEEVSICGSKPDGEALRSIVNKLSNKRHLRDLDLKHYHMSTAQFKKRTTHLDIPGRIYDLYKHVVKTCPFCNSTKPRHDRSRMNGFRASNLDNSSFCTMDRQKMETKPLDCLLSWMERHHI